jgi:PadR family transcriptional regulator, regulatory protein PadR
MNSDGLRELEHLVLLALSRLEGPVHAVPIVKELVVVVSRSISRASVYVVLRRLEVKGYVTSTMGDATPQRGGRAKRLYALTPLAVRSLKTAQQNFVRLWAGSRVLMCLFLVAAAASTALHAQSRPNLTGVWINLSDPNATDEKTASNLPNALLTIKHDGSRFDLTRSWSNAPIVESHVCDGRTNKNGYSIVVERTTCRWDTTQGGTLIIEGTIGREDGEVVGTLKQRYWLDDKGVMQVERMRNVTGVTPAPRTYTQQYRKLR